MIEDIISLISDITKIGFGGIGAFICMLGLGIGYDPAMYGGVLILAIAVMTKTYNAIIAIVVFIIGGVYFALFDTANFWWIFTFICLTFFFLGLNLFIIGKD